MRSVWLLAILLAGCTSAGVDVDASPPTEDLGPRPDTTYGHVATGPAAQPDLNATTAAAPRLAEGEWWRIQYTSFGISELVEVVRVVANATKDGYILGMPHDGWLKEAVSFHSPSFGDVNLDLSYDTHNMRFEPVRFPLVEGATWETHFAATPYTAVVDAVDTYTATIRFLPADADDPERPVTEALGLAGLEMVLDYDARQHDIVRMESALGVWEVVEHGYGFEGWVTVPDGAETAIDHGAFGPASASHDVRERQLEVEGDFNRMTMMHFVGTLGPSPGYVKLRHVNPEGDAWTTELIGSGMQVSFFETNDPVGTWTVEDTAVGAAFTYSMGIAYLQYDIRLPDGARRGDHGHAVVR